MRFAKFGAVGVVNTAVAYAVFVVLAVLLGVAAPVAHALGWLGGMATSWTLNRRWTFGDRAISTRGGLVRFIVANLVVMGGGALALAVATPAMRGLAASVGLRAGLALSALEAGVLAASVAANYALATLWVFRSKAPNA